MSEDLFMIREVLCVAQPVSKQEKTLRDVTACGLQDRTLQMLETFLALMVWYLVTDQVSDLSIKMFLFSFHPQREVINKQNGKTTITTMSAIRNFKQEVY